MAQRCPEALPHQLISPAYPHTLTRVDLLSAGLRDTLRGIVPFNAYFTIEGDENGIWAQLVGGFPELPYQTVDIGCARQEIRTLELGDASKVKFVDFTNAIIHLEYGEEVIGECSSPQEAVAKITECFSRKIEQIGIP